MQILYVSPEHISGTLGTMRDAHIAAGDECRFLTMFRNRYDFPADIELNLPASPGGGWFARAKDLRRRWKGLPIDPELPTPPGYPPLWQPDDGVAKLVFNLRELWWTPLIDRARKSYRLDDFDVYQFDMGIEFFRDGRWVKQLRQRDKFLISFYHGTDVRNRGVIAPVDEACQLRLTSELDLLYLHPTVEYLFLPIPLQLFSASERVMRDDKVVRIGHAARNRKLKGSEAVIRAVASLQRKGYAVELDMMEGLTHREVMMRKQNCDIAVDQLTDLGGWGYGMSALEFFAFGIPVVTKMRSEYDAFLPNHPFVHADEETVERALEKLIVDRDYREQKGREGRRFVEQYHDAPVVTRQWYDYLKRAGRISEVPPSLQDIVVQPMVPVERRPR